MAGGAIDLHEVALPKILDPRGVWGSIRAPMFLVCSRTSCGRGFVKVAVIRFEAKAAGAVAHFQRAMMMDVDQAAKAMRDEEMLAEIEDFIEGFNQPTYRGMRVNGVRVATWSSRDGWSGDTRPDAEWLQ